MAIRSLRITLLVPLVALSGCSGSPPADSGTTAPATDGGSQVEAASSNTDDAGAPPLDGSVTTSETGALDAADARPDPRPDAQGDTGVSGNSYSCSEIIGVSVTGDWFGGGFLDGVDATRWEARTRSLAFVEQWADPANAVWSVPTVNACAQGASSPTRVVFMGVNWTYTTSAEWVTALTGVVNTLEARYPGLQRIELLTMLRAPGNVSCGNSETVVQPFIDDAIATVAAMKPGLVVAAPKFFAPSCAVFTGGGPHFTAAGIPIVAGLYSAYYATN